MSDYRDRLAARVMPYSVAIGNAARVLAAAERDMFQVELAGGAHAVAEAAHCGGKPVEEVERLYMALPREAP